MLDLLSRIPVSSQRSAARGLLSAAGFAALLGLLMFTGFLDSSREECSGVLLWRTCTTLEVPTAERLPPLLGAIGLGLVALVCVVLALRLFTLQGTLSRYVAILAGVETIPVQRIADITGATPTRVRADIQSMIDSGMITDFYVDLAADQVVSKKYVPKTSHKTVVTCTGCGGNNEIIVGITATCSYCGQPLILRTS